MDGIIEVIKAQPLYGIIAIAVALLVVVSVVKKLVTLALVGLLVLGGYMAYLHQVGEDVPTRAEQVKEELRGAASLAKHKLGDAVQESAKKALGSDLRKKLEKDVKRAVNKGINEELDRRFE